MITSRNIDPRGGAIHIAIAGTAGPWVVFIHGNSSSSRIFQPQLDSPLANRCRLAAIDLPGHGESTDARRPDETCTLPGYAAVIRDALRELAIESPVLVGWSLGGHVAVEMAAGGSRVAGLVLYGAPPIDQSPDCIDLAFLPDPDVGLAFQEHLTAAEQRRFARGLFHSATPVPAFCATDLRRTDGRARRFLGESLARGHYADEVDYVRRSKVPLAMLHGRYEPYVSLPYLESLAYGNLWTDRVHVFERCGHTPNWEDPDSFNRILGEFITDIGAW